MHPALLREDLLLAKVDGVYNAIQIQGQLVGRSLMYGVLAAISQVFAKWDISIGSVIQKESDEVSQTAELVVLTHVSKESAVQQAAKEIIGLEEVESIGSLIRVESDV